MEPSIMGRVVTQATITNMQDLWAVERGLLPADQVRRLVVQDALVDTGATTLSMPTRLLQQLGLKKRYDKRIRTSSGSAIAGMYEVARLTIQDRECSVDVMEVPDDVPVLIGQIPLEMLDLVIDPRGGRLTGNPAHGGEHIIEMY